MAWAEKSTSSTFLEWAIFLLLLWTLDQRGRMEGARMHVRSDSNNLAQAWNDSRTAPRFFKFLLWCVGRLMRASARLDVGHIRRELNTMADDLGRGELDWAKGKGGLRCTGLSMVDAVELARDA